MSAKISELPDADLPLTGTELMEVVQGGVNKKVAKSDVSTGGGGAVDSVNGETGVVVLDATDVGADPAGSASTVNTALGNHISDATDAHAGTAITNTPAGNISATNVQAAINELDTEKQSAAQVQAIADAKVADAINDGTTTVAPSQNAVFDALALKQALLNSSVAITDAASMDLTAIKHTLTTSSATRTFTISYTGDDISMKVILNATSSVFTFPAGALCINSDGAASGNNTCSLAGVSGDVYVFAVKHWGSSVYTVVCRNTGQ